MDKNFRYFLLSKHKHHYYHVHISHITINFQVLIVNHVNQLYCAKSHQTGLLSYELVVSLAVFFGKCKKKKPNKFKDWLKEA